MTGNSKYLIAVMAGMLPAAGLAQQVVVSSAGADESSAEIVVTAQRRSEKSRDVPISITSLNSAQLTAANVSQLGDIARLTPSLRFDTAGSNVQPTIRGVGTAVSSSGAGPNVGIYVDGFYVANPAVGSFDLMGVQSIQVLKGPQGTLFGRNATGGAILVTTADPSIEPAAEFRASYGRFDSVKLQGYGTFGISDRVAVDVEGLYRAGNGYFTNIIDGNDRIGKYENWQARFGIKAEISDSASILLRYTRADTDDPTFLTFNAYVDRNGEARFFDRFVSAAGQAAYGRSSSAGLPLVALGVPASTVATRPGQVAQDPAFPAVFTNKSDILHGTIKVDLGFANLTSYTQYRKDRAVNREDIDATSNNFFNIYIGVKNKLLTQELLLSSQAGGPLQWTAGLYYFENRDTYIVSGAFGLPNFDPVAPYNPFGGSSSNTRSYAAYADLTYELTPRIFMTVGARFGQDRISDAYLYVANPTAVSRDAQQRIDVPSYKSKRVTPRVVLRYKPSDYSSVYASYTRGYKAGLLNLGTGSPVLAPPVRPEDIDAFELGYKYSSRGLSLDLSAYYYGYRNLQVSSFLNGVALINNAAESKIYGFDAAVSYKLTDSFDLNAGLAYSHARYKEFNPSAKSAGAPFYSYCDPTVTSGSLQCLSPISQPFGDASGLRMQRAPDFTASIGGSYHVGLAGGKLTLGGNLYYTSKVYFGPAEQFYQNGYAIVAARAQWVDPSGRYTVAISGDNLMNKRYLSAVQYTQLGIGAVWGAPRTWAISIGAKY